MSGGAEEVRRDTNKFLARQEWAKAVVRHLLGEETLEHVLEKAACVDYYSRVGHLREETRRIIEALKRKDRDAWQAVLEALEGEYEPMKSVLQQLLGEHLQCWGRCPVCRRLLHTSMLEPLFRSEG